MFAGRDAYPSAVAAGESGFVAVGGRTFLDVTTPAGGTAGAWWSADGLTWKPATVNAALAIGDDVPTSGPEPGILDVAAGPTGFVAVGIVFERSSVATPSPVTGAFWYSPDGRTWTRALVPGADLVRPASVTWDGSSFVVVGVVEGKDAPRAAAWTSADGRAWARVADSPAFDIGGYIDTMEYHAWGGPSDITSAANGDVYALGLTCSANLPGAATACRPVAWRSSAGGPWQLLDPGPVAAPSWLASIAASADRLVAVGGPLADTDQHGQLLTYSGTTWQLLEPAGVPRLARVVAYGEGFLAASTAGGTISLWVSPDGIAWSELSDVPQPNGVLSLRGIDLAARGDRVVLVGSAEIGDSSIGVSGFAIILPPK
jgi:hypothetical protein